MIRLKNAIFIISLTCSIGGILLAKQQPGAAPELTENAGLSPEEKMWYDAINTMSEEEQMQLWNGIVEEVQKEANKLPAGEREKFLESFWAEVSNEAVKLEQKIQNSSPAPAPIAEPVKQKPVAVEQKPVVTKQANSKIDQAAQMIDSLLTRLENLLRKTHIIPDLNGKIQDWAKNGSLDSFPPQGTWASLKTDLEKLVAQLHKLKDKDPKTKEYKHLPELIKSEGLYNNLSQLSRTLSSYESKVEVPDFGSNTLAPAAKNALINVLNSAIEALYVLKVPQALEQLISKYDERARVIKEEQEKAVKAAHAAPTKGKVSPASTSGTAAKRPEFHEGDDEFFKGGSTKGSSYYDSFLNPSTATSKTDTFGKPDQKADGAKAGQQKPAAPALDKDKDKKPGDVKKKTEEKPKDKDDKEKGDSSADDYVKRLVSNLEGLIDTIIDSHLENIDTYMSSASSVNQQWATSVLPGMASKARKGLDDARALRKRVTNLKDKPDLVKKYKERVQELLESKENDLRSFSQKIANIRGRESSISADKSYAFLGGLKQPTNQALLDNIPNPASLYDLQRQIDEIISTLKSIR